MDINKLPQELRDQVYKPNPDEVRPLDLHRTPDGQEPQEPNFVLDEKSDEG